METEQKKEEKREWKKKDKTPLSFSFYSASVYSPLKTIMTTI